MSVATQLRTARPTNALEPLRRFYVNGAGLTVKSSFTGHEGFDGLILSAGDASWEIELVVEAGVQAPRAPSHEHLLVLSLPAKEVERRAERMEALGYEPVKPNNPWWARHGVTFEDPDGYQLVLCRRERPVPPALPSDVTVRFAVQPADAAALDALHRAVWSDANTPTGQPPVSFDPARTTFVAERAGVVVGAVQFGRRTAYEANAHVGILAWLAVSPTARNQRVGARLVAHVVDYATRAGFTKLYLSVLAINPHAIRLYESFGFEVEGRRLGEFRLRGQLVDSLEYARSLP